MGTRGLLPDRPDGASALPYILGAQPDLHEMYPRSAPHLYQGTRLFVFAQSGVQLRLNVNAGGPGVVRVAVVGSDGTPTAGYSLAECRPLMGNFVDEPVTWKPSEGQAEVRRLPGSGGSVRVVKIVGLTRAKDMVMLGKRIPALQAKEWGLITDVAEDSDELTVLIEDYAANLNAKAPLALRALKRVLNSVYDTSLKVALDIEGHSYEKLRSTADYKEGIDAFAEKRKPKYTGS